MTTLGFWQRCHWAGECLVFPPAEDCWDSRLGRMVSPRRYAYREYFGEVPRGWLVVHRRSCLPGCVRADHLVAVSPCEFEQLKAAGPIRHRGVFRRGNKWVAFVYAADGVRHSAGHYTSLDAAADAATRLRKQLSSAVRR
jgi:hypothetical protein